MVHTPLLHSLALTVKVIQVTHMATKHANVNLFTQIWSIFLHASLGVEGWLGVGWVVDFGWFQCDEDITMLDTTIPSIELQGLIMRS
jgi:hypothetical protein